MDSKEATSYPLAEIVSDNNEENSKNYSKGTVSEDEGYVSGEEEFVAALDKPIVGEIVGESIGEGNSDDPFVDALEKVEPAPIPGVVVDDGDDVEKVNKVVEGQENGGVENFDGKGEILDSAEKLGVNSNEGVAEEVEMGEKIESLKIEDEVTKDEAKEVSEGAFVEQGESEFIDTSDVKVTPEGDSVVDTIQVDVAGPGVAVVGETEKSGDGLNKPEEKEVDEVAVVEQEKSEVVTGLDDVAVEPDEDSVVNTVQVDVADREVDVVGETEENGESEVKEVVEAEKPEVVGGLGDVKLTTEGDSVIDSIQVDVAGPGVVLVGETKENRDADNEPEAKEVVEPEKSEVVDLGDVKLTPKGDSVVDAIQIDKVGPGVAVVGKLEENGGEKIEGVDVPLVSIDSENGDGVEEEVGTREVVVDNESSEPPVESKDEIVEPKPLQTELSAVEDEKELIENGTNGEYMPVDEISNDDEGSKPVFDPQEIREVEDEMDEEVYNPIEDSDGDSTDGMIFGGSEAAKKFIEDLERESGGEYSQTGGDTSLVESRGLDGQIVTDSEEEEGETDDDDEGDGKELFDSAALAALLKAATGADSDGSGNITITSQDGSRLFSVERPAGLGSSLRSLRPVPQPMARPNLFNPLAPSIGGGEVEENLSEEEKKKLEKLQAIKVKFLRLVHRLGLSAEESVAAQVLYRLALLGGRQGTQTFSLDAAKRTALELETEGRDDLDFSINILVLGKSGVGKSATINSLFGEEKAPIDAFETGTTGSREISGLVDGVNVRVVDTPGLKTSVMEQGFNRSVLSSAKKLTKKNPTDVVLYVDRLDAQTRDLNDLPLLKTITASLSPTIWRSAIVTLTHGASAPPDGPTGAPLSYEVFVSQRSHVLQQSIGHAVGDMRMMSPSLMNPVSLVENHPSCRKNRDGHKILPNGQSWRPQLLLLCYSMKILSEASSVSKPQDPFDHRKLFGFRARSPPLPYMLSSMLQSRPHPKLAQAEENGDSDIDLDDLSDSDQEDEDEYDQLPAFKPLRKAQMAKLTKEQKKAYFEEYDYRVKLLQKKQWREELRRMKEIKKRGKDYAVGPNYEEDADADGGAAAPVSVPLPDMALPPSFDGDNPAYRYRFLEPTSQFLARPVLDSHGWDHDCGYDGVNLEHSLAIASRFPAAYTVQVTKDKKDFTFSLDSSISAKHGENMNVSTMAGFDIQSMGKQLAYIVRAETKTKNIKKHKAAGGLTFTFLGENIIPGVKIEDQVLLGKQYVLVGSAGAVKSQTDTAYGANFELQRREDDYPIGQVQSTISCSIIKWRGDLALGLNGLAQFSIGRNSKVAVRGGINNKMSGQVTVRTSSSDHLSLALVAVIPTVLSIYKKLWPGAGDKYAIY